MRGALRKNKNEWPAASVLNFSYRSTPLHPECLVRDCRGLHIPPVLSWDCVRNESENGPGQKYVFGVS